MWFRWWRMAGVAATGAAAAAALFAGYREARKAISLPAEPLHALEALCVAGVLGAGVALLAVEWTRRAYRRLLTRLASRVAELRHNPAPHGLHELDRLLPPHPEAAAVQEQVEALTSCYRTALCKSSRRKRGSKSCAPTSGKVPRSTNDRPRLLPALSTPAARFACRLASRRACAGRPSHLRCCNGSDAPSAISSPGRFSIWSTPLMSPSWAAPCNKPCATARPTTSPFASSCPTGPSAACKPT